MQIEKNLDILDVEVTVDISHEEIQQAIIEHGDTGSALKRTLGNFSQYMDALSDEQINQLTPEVRKIVYDFFMKQSLRFAE